LQTREVVLRMTEPQVPSPVPEDPDDETREPDETALQDGSDDYDPENPAPPSWIKR